MIQPHGGSLSYHWWPWPDYLTSKPGSPAQHSSGKRSVLFVIVLVLGSFGGRGNSSNILWSF